MKPVYFILSIVFATALLAFGVYNLSRYIHLINVGTTTIGTITQIEPISSRSHTDSITFMARSSSIEIQRTTSLEREQVGDKVNVFYDPQHPEVAMVNGHMSVFIYSVLSILAGLLGWMIIGRELLKKK